MLFFQNLEYLWALALLPILVILYINVVKWKKRTAKKLGDPNLVKALMADYSPSKFLLKFILIASAVVLSVIGLAGLVTPDKNQKVNRKGIDMVIALDVSKSMLAQDIKPNRLERARQVISKVIDQSPDDRIGLVLFAGRAYLQMPLTVDHGAAKMYLSAASPDDVPAQGTVISQALKMSYAAFNPDDKTFKSILLISDGEDHNDDALKTAKELGKAGVMINTIGIGSPDGAPIMDEGTHNYKTDSKGQMVITKLNEKELSDIAQAGNGIYQLYSSTDHVATNLTAALKNIGQKEAGSVSSFSSFKQYFQYFIGAALLLLLIEFFISEKKKRTAVALVWVVFFMLPSNSLFAQSANGLISKGNEAYKANKLDEAEKEYKEAAKNEDQKVTADYNLGNVFYKKNKLEDAVKSYDEAIAGAKENTTKQQAYYNKGVAYQKANKLPECIMAYKNALLLNQNDEDARQNLQRALKQQQQQKNKDDKDQKKKQDPDKKNQPQNQQPKPQPSKMSKQDADEKLKSLEENEKALQDKLHKIKGVSPDKPEKDW
ncbi:MAG: VWA domain-containing protein [Ginsengibacter sp.]